MKKVKCGEEIVGEKERAAIDSGFFSVVGASQTVKTVVAVDSSRSYLQVLSRFPRRMCTKIFLIILAFLSKFSLKIFFA